MSEETKAAMPCDSVRALRADAAALKQLSDIEQVIEKPPALGGFHFSDAEREFVRIVRERFNTRLEFEASEREAIAALWAAMRGGLV